MSDEPAVTPVAEPTPPPAEAVPSVAADPAPVSSVAEPGATNSVIMATPPESVSVVASPDPQPVPPPTPQHEPAIPDPQAQPVVSATPTESITVNPTPAPVPTPVQQPATVTSTSSTSSSPRSFLTRALASIQFRKQAKLAKIMKYAQEKKSLTNDQVEKLLHISDSTATRYLNQLVRENKLKRVGPVAHAHYELP